MTIAGVQLQKSATNANCSVKYGWPSINTNMTDMVAISICFQNSNRNSQERGIFSIIPEDWKDLKCCTYYQFVYQIAPCVPVALELTYTWYSNFMFTGLRG